MLETDSLPSQPGQASGFCPPVALRFSPLVGKYLPFLSFFLSFPCPLHWERGVSSRGPACTTIYDRTWNLPPPWAGPLHLVEERVVLKSQPTSSLPPDSPPLGEKGTP